MHALYRAAGTHVAAAGGVAENRARPPSRGLSTETDTYSASEETGWKLLSGVAGIPVVMRWFATPYANT